MSGYRVAKRTESGVEGSRGVWSNDRHRWLDVIYTTEREAQAMMAHLIAAERRRGLPGSEKR